MAITRFSGWTMQYLKKVRETLKINQPNKYSLIDTVRFVGLGARIIKDLRCLNSLNKNQSIKIRPTSGCFEDITTITANFFNEGFNATYIKYINSIKLLVLRSKRARLNAILRPAHGQRRWHNANTVRICNLFLNGFCKSYELDLFEYGTVKGFRYTKIWEMRQKALVKKKKVKKKFKKFKKFGERQVVKLRKKTPWD